ncbi:unnamed protein product [Plutella xylostella]|uniref:(diamondback moth) hypothetical protein n=1 Tax=Plutella xylostella TaxID=51655 RepID=A0A8S4GHJ5_PLUXY|nr:unnamed protein product [Plutella xylostella]
MSPLCLHHIYYVELAERPDRPAGGAFEGVEDQVSPFGYGRGEGVDAGHGDPDWICSKEKPRYDQLFQSLNPIDGKVTGAGTYPPRLLAGATHSCSLLTQLCLKASETGDPNIDKLVDALAAAAQTCKLLAQMSAADADVSGVSIHSLHGASADAIDYAQSLGSPDQTSTLPDVDEVDDDDDSETQVAAKTEMVKSKLPNSVLGKIWKLSDIDKDGFLDDEEFALAMHLMQVKIDGHDLPASCRRTSCPE